MTLFSMRLKQFASKQVFVCKLQTYDIKGYVHIFNAMYPLEQVGTQTEHVDEKDIPEFAATVVLSLNKYF